MVNKRIKDCTIDEIIRYCNKHACLKCVFYKDGVSRGEDLNCSISDIFYLPLDNTLTTEIEIDEA